MMLLSIQMNNTFVTIFHLLPVFLFNFRNFVPNNELIIYEDL